MGLVYVLSNSVMPGLVKIGRTDQDDASTRIAQLYTTGVPVPFTIEFAARVPDAAAVEEALHEAFAPYRINPKREFFRLDPNQAIAILKLLHVENVTSEVAETAGTGIDEQSLAAAVQQRTRRPNFNFEEMGIPVGAVLQSAHNDATAEVIDARRVRFGDDVVYLSTATRQMLGVEYQVAPGPHWLYQGKRLQDLYEATYGDA